MLREHRARLVSRQALGLDEGWGGQIVRLVSAPAAKSEAAAPGSWGSGGGSKGSAAEGASGEAAQGTETKAEVVVELNRIELSAS